MSERKHRIVIAQHRPWLRTTLVVVATALLALGAWALYSYTRASTASEYAHAETERDRLLDENRRLARQLRSSREDNRNLSDQLAYIKRSGEIDGDACTLVKKSLAGMQQENSNLREQLAFYRGIAAPAQSSEGLRVYDLKITPADGKASAYDFELLLIQPMHHDQLVKGRADIAFVGLSDGQLQQVPFAKVALSSDKNLVFSFKYFQELDGRFRLPAGFRPVRVSVTLTPEGGGAKVEETYDWAKIEHITGVAK